MSQQQLVQRPLKEALFEAEKISHIQENGSLFTGRPTVPEFVCQTTQLEVWITTHPATLPRLSPFVLLRPSG